jgi:hypothetical protein
MIDFKKLIFIAIEFPYMLIWFDGLLVNSSFIWIFYLIKFIFFF